MHSLPKKAALLGFAACMAVASPSFADRVAALVPQVKPPPPPELRDRFHEAISRGLQGSGVEVLPAAEVRLRLGSSDEMLNCSGVGPCVARSAQALSADRLVSADISITGKDYTIKLRMLDPVGREVAKVDEPCDICTVKEADEAMARAATKLTTAAKSAGPTETAPPPPQPRVETPPPQPPPQLTPPPRAEPTPPPTSTAPVTPTPAVSTRAERHVPWRALAITSLVVGVVGIGGGAALVAIDGQPTCGLANPKQSCPEVYNTVGGGAALLSLGIAGVAASGAMFYLDYRARHKPHPTVMLVPTRDGAYLTASGRF